MGKLPPSNIQAERRRFPWWLTILLTVSGLALTLVGALPMLFYHGSVGVPKAAILGAVAGTGLMCCVVAVLERVLKLMPK